jgi:hypothetical protein
VVRLLRWLLTPLVILGALFVGANFFVKHLAEDKVASALQTEFHLSAKPSVSIGGFPIITDILSGHLSRVSFRAPRASFEGLTLDTIAVTLVDVRAAGGFLGGAPLHIRVGAGTISAHATDAAVNAYLKAHKKNATIAFLPGRAVVRARRIFFGRTRTFVASGTIAREGGSLVFHPTSVTIDGHPPPPGAEGLAERLTTVKVALPDLPGGVSTYGIKAGEGAIVVSAVLRDQVLDLQG